MITRLRALRWFAVTSGFAASISAVVLSVGGSNAAGPDDGTWRGASVGSFGPGCATTTATSFVVQGDRLTGEDVISPGSFMPAGRFPLHASITGDGNVRGSVGDWSLRGKLSGDSFEGDYEFGPCTMIMRLGWAER
jgi:hypothetical protein